MKKELIFKDDVKEDDQVIWARGKTYLVTDEDKKFYYLGEFAERGISKDLDAIAYFVIKK